jgi:hypothetical protein
MLLLLMDEAGMYALFHLRYHTITIRVPTA